MGCTLARTGIRSPRRRPPHGSRRRGQLIDVNTGEGVLTTTCHTYTITRGYAPQLVLTMRAAHQQQGEISFTAANALQYPLALIAMVLLPLIVWLARRKALPAEIGEFAAVVTLALLGNAFVCGALSIRTTATARAWSGLHRSWSFWRSRVFPATGCRGAC